jgi:exosortase
MIAQTHVRFRIILALAVVAWWPPLYSLVRLALSNENYSYVLLVLVVSAALGWLEFGRPRVEQQWSFPSVLLIATVLAAAAWGNYRAAFSGAGTRLSCAILCFTLSVLCVFVQVYGWQAFRRAPFPLLLLFLAVPLPSEVVSKLVAWLQWGSADVVYALFRLFRVPVVRNGLVFSLSNLEIEVAQECSSIRSSTILIVTTVVLAYLFLRSGWTRAIAVLAALPISVLKNGVRIFTLSVLGEYVSTSWLEGSLHHQGGFVFLALGLALIIVVIALLRMGEVQRRNRASESVAFESPAR